MSKRYLVMLSILSMFLLSGAVANGQTILNGDFEGGDSPWSFRNGWSRTCNDSYSGNCAAKYETAIQNRTSIAFQFFTISPSGNCRLSVWIKTDLLDDAFNADGSPSRTGVSVQLWDMNGRRGRTVLDLARQNLFRVGYRGQGGMQDWTEYAADVSMDEGDWKVTLYMHPIRDRNRRTIAQPTGIALVDDLKLIRISDQ